MVSPVEQFQEIHDYKTEEGQGPHGKSLVATVADDEQQVSGKVISPLEHFSIGALRDGRLRVRSPFVAKLAKENEDYIAEAEEIHEFGFGENPSEAIADLQQAIAELYLTLEQEQNRLGADLAAVWSTLQAKVVRRA